MKTCYYELLSVPSTASDSELKKAYRKAALQYHPDKNRDNIEEATHQFALIRSAYEVLSDPQERAWYDAHKTQILRGDEPGGTGSGSEYEDAPPAVAGLTAEAIYRYFDPSLYTNLSDSVYGFYHIVGQVFGTIAHEEVAAGKQQNLAGFSEFQDDEASAAAADTQHLLFPQFGTSTSSYAQQVRRFYQAWSSFVTVKTFSWKDEFRYSQAYDRRTKRSMEKENKKLRDAAKKEYNEAVRSFVSFVKKRDPRVKIGMKNFEREKKLKQQQELQRQVERDRMLSEERARAGLGGMGAFAEQSWQQIDDDEFQEIESYFNDREKKKGQAQRDAVQDEAAAEPDEEKVFECVICDKIFKNENQFSSHENSNKHKKLLSRLKWEMRQEGIVLGIDSVSDEDEFDTANEDSDVGSLSGSSEPDDMDEELRRIERELAELERSEDAQSSSSDSQANSQANSEAHSQAEAQTLEPEVDDDLEDDLEDLGLEDLDPGLEDLDPQPKKLSKKEKKKQKYQKPTSSAGSAPEPPAEADELTKLAQALEQGKLSLADDSDDNWGSSKPKKKKKPKADNTNPKPAASTSSPTTTAAETCTVCDQQFSSRNKLFQHVNSTGHALAPKNKKKSKKAKK